MKGSGTVMNLWFFGIFTDLLTALNPHFLRTVSKVPISKQVIKKTFIASLRFFFASASVCPCVVTSRGGHDETKTLAFFFIVIGNLTLNTTSIMAPRTFFIYFFGLLFPFLKL
jgi:hypothetical protein